MLLKTTFLIFMWMIVQVVSYDPSDKEIETIIPTPGTFEAFYPRENGIPNTASRSDFSHGSFFAHRNPGRLKLISELNFENINSVF